MDKRSFRKVEIVEIEEIVAMIRLSLYNRSRAHGANAIFQEMESMGVRPLPSPRSINRILARLGFTHGRTGHYP
jgi:putative transposase